MAEEDSSSGPVTQWMTKLAALVLGVGSLLTAVAAFRTGLTEFKSAMFGDRPASASSEGSLSSCRPSDGQAAWDDSNNCYIAYKNGQIAEAETACNRGLTEARCAKRLDVEGMLYFNLGLCAESRADWKSAQELYESSLQARPGNATVQDRLTAVTLRLASSK
jgi:hypothetical protein